MSYLDEQPPTPIFQPQPMPMQQMGMPLENLQYITDYQYPEDSIPRKYLDTFWSINPQLVLGNNDEQSIRIQYRLQKIAITYFEAGWLEDFHLVQTRMAHESQLQRSKDGFERIQVGKSTTESTVTTRQQSGGGSSSGVLGGLRSRLFGGGRR